MVKVNTIIFYEKKRKSYHTVLKNVFEILETMQIYQYSITAHLDMNQIEHSIAYCFWKCTKQDSNIAH